MIMGTIQTLWFAIGLLIALNTYQLYRIAGYNASLKEQSVTLTEAEKLLESLKSDNENLLAILGYHILYENSRIEKLNPATRPTFSGDDARLIYFVPELSCDICYDDLIEKIKNFRQTVGANKVMVWSSSRRLREVKAFFKEKKADIDIVAVDDIGLALETGYIPFFFLVDRFGHVKNIHVPVIHHFTLTDEYLQRISRQYFLP
jgi:hypothetical protein